MRGQIADKERYARERKNYQLKNLLYIIFQNRYLCVWHMRTCWCITGHWLIYITNVLLIWECAVTTHDANWYTYQSLDAIDNRPKVRQWSVFDIIVGVRPSHNHLNLQAQCWHLWCPFEALLLGVNSNSPLSVLPALFLSFVITERERASRPDLTCQQ